MSCTTLLVGKSASYDGSTIIARNDDSGSGTYDPKHFVAVAPADPQAPNRCNHSDSGPHSYHHLQP